jgi:hypothetical protein
MQHTEGVLSKYLNGTRGDGSRSCDMPQGCPLGCNHYGLIFQKITCLTAFLSDENICKTITKIALFYILNFFRIE